MSEWWASDSAHQLGTRIAADKEQGTGLYRLLARLPCQQCMAAHRRARTILAQYAGPGGTKWLWTPGYQGLVNHPGPVARPTDPVRTERIPPRAWAYEAGLFAIAVCQECRHGQPFHVTTEGIDLNFDPAPATFGRVAEG